MEILFWRHQTSSQRKKGQCTIYCRVTVDGEREDLGSTNIKTYYDFFNPDKGRIECADPYYIEKNTRIAEEFERSILTIYNELSLKNQPITAEVIKNKFKGGGKGYRIIELYDRYLKYFEGLTKLPEVKIKKKKKASPRRSESTIAPLTTCRNKMLTYVLEKRLQGELVDNLTEKFLKDYEDWLWSIGHEQSTVVKHLRTFKQITKWAYKEAKLISADPCADIRVDKEEEKEPVFLTLEQFEVWKNFKFRSKAAQEVADIFTVYCRTALSYIDLVQIVENPEAYFKTGLDGKTWIYKPREKTEEISKVPVSSFADLDPVIKKYGGWGNLPIRANKTLNEWLKLCVAEVNMHLADDMKIFEELSVKHGRSTFSDWWINTLGNSTESLLPIMGRTSASGLRRYVRPDERAVIAALNKG